MRPPFIEAPSNMQSQAAHKVLRRTNVGALPLLVALPLMYWPRVLNGDTQPWVLIAALIALFSFRTDRFSRRSDGLPIFLSIASAIAYAARADIGPDLLRALYTQLAFITFWLVCRRDTEDVFATAVRITIVIWLLVGLYQYVGVISGWEIEFSGRFVQGRGGVPSLTSEPSTYGSLSMLQMMYLLGRDDRRNKPYILGAAASVVLSGSVLALLLLAFPVLRLKGRLRIIVLAAIPILAASDYYLTSAGLTSRLSNIFSGSSDLTTLLLDPSLNLRAGHIYFTLVENFWRELTLQSPLDFMNQYNAYADRIGIFIPTGSNFILPAMGELIYGSGIFGLLLLLSVFHLAIPRRDVPAAKLEKIAFITACMLNPISFSNFFLLLYINRKA